MREERMNSERIYFDLHSHFKNYPNQSVIVFNSVNLFEDQL